MLQAVGLLPGLRYTEKGKWCARPWQRDGVGLTTHLEGKL